MTPREIQSFPPCPCVSLSPFLLVPHFTFLNRWRGFPLTLFDDSLIFLSLQIGINLFLLVSTFQVESVSGAPWMAKHPKNSNTLRMLLVVGAIVIVGGILFA